MVMERAELNSNEKLALMTTGIEGEGEHFIINGEAADKALLREKKEKFNTMVDEYVDKFERHNEALENYAKKISEDMNGLEIMPVFNYLLIKPFDQNPFQRVKTTESGIIFDLGGQAIEHKSNETGEWEEDKQFIKVGTVVETGHKCEFIQPGDVVMFTIASEIPVPFYKMGFVSVAESRIIAVVNEKLTERKNEFKYGNK